MDFEIWQKTGPRRLNASFGPNILSHLQNLNRILQEETHSAAPHLCMQYVSVSQVYILVTLVGSASLNEETTRQAIRFFNLVIDSEEEDFLEDEAFADRLISFVRVAATRMNGMTPDTESELIELLFAIAAKLRQRPTIPAAWFRPTGDTNRKRLSQTGVPISKSQEFPLMYLLLGRVHNDGKIGDFARTGLLYVLELAGRAENLEKWIIECELATMMASGLGALYSQLSSKVSLSYPADSKPPVLAFSDVIDSGYRGGAEPIHSTTLQADLATFASFLNFWQDVLERCPSDDINATLLDHFDFLFLRPLLYVHRDSLDRNPPNAQSRYPSLVESSDSDSGSSVAVLTYLTYILETFNETRLIRLMLHYMLGAPAQLSPVEKPSRPSTLAQRRKSETLISNNARRIDDPSPDLVTLTNILHGYLMSRNQQTVTASLRLLATILRLWHEFANTTLMKIQSSRNPSSKRPKATHEQQLEVLYSLTEDLLDNEGLEASYESHLQDAQDILETHPCSTRQLYFSNEIVEKMVPKKRSIQRMIAPDDQLVTCLLSLLENFLVNDIEVNLSLSETLAALASCRETSLEGWLLSSPSEALDNNAAKNEDHPDCTNSRQDGYDASPVFARLESLVERIDRLRRDIQDFDIYLAERRHIFQVGGEIDDALAGTSGRRSHESHEQHKRSIQKDPTAIGSISGRLGASRAASRSTSPRGRQEGYSNGNHPQPKSVVGRMSHLRLSPSPSSSSPLDRTYSPSPLRAQSMSTTASSSLPSPRGPPDALRQRIRLKMTTIGPRRQPRDDSGGSETSSLHSESLKAGSDVVGGGEEKEVSLSHLLTNVIILQEFIMELAAIIQVRASLFGEVGLY
ncbi:MAG: hypothetical protein Q9197_003512 [Variospora fuerteventurae]